MATGIPNTWHYDVASDCYLVPDGYGNHYWVTRQMLEDGMFNIFGNGANVLGSPGLGNYTTYPAAGSGTWTTTTTNHTHASYQLAQQQYQQALLQQAQAFGQAPSQLLNHNPPKHEGIRAGEVIGWRGWRVINGFLNSMTMSDYQWDPIKGAEGIPDKHGEGIYAYKDPIGPLEDGYCGFNSMSVYPWVLGEVALWGEVVEYSAGYRAQYAKPRSFMMWSRLVNQETRSTLTELYLGSRT